MEPLRTSKLNAQIYEEASAWFVENRAGDLQDSERREFDKWLRRSPEHLSAYLEIAAVWSEGPALDPTHKWDADTLIAEARREAANVVPLSGTSAVPGLEEAVPPKQSVASVPTRRSFYRRKRLALAASLAALAVFGAAWIWLAVFSSLYSTGVGEQRSIMLGDGSTVEMNSRSKIRVRYSTSERAVDLLEGQALFHVAKDKARPFIVSADGTQVRAVGTQFDVYEKVSGTVVTVVEGQVAVLTAEPTAPVNAPLPQSTDRAPPERQTPVLVSAGEQLTVTPKLARKSEHPNIAAATAWTERRIVFESATLSEVAEEFNRYNQRQLIIEDPDLYGFHISGVFSSTDPDSLIRFLRERAGVRVTEDAAEIRIAKNI